MKRVALGLSTLLAIGACNAPATSSVEGAGEANEVSRLASKAGAAAGCAFRVTENTYDGSEYWGTITIANGGPASSSAYSISFDVPAGVTCDYADRGWTYSQRGVTCTYSHPGAKLAAGASVTLHYSTDSTDFSAAVNVKVADAACAAPTPTPTPAPTPTPTPQPSACTFHVTENTYDGAGYWGTITFVNNGPAASTAYSVSFDVPAGVTCDYADRGWTYSQRGVTCSYSQPGAKLAAGASATLHYSTDSTDFSAAANIKIADAACTAPTPTPTPTPGPTPTPAPTPTPTPVPSGPVNLFDPGKRDIAMSLVASAEESTTDWRSQYSYIEDIGDGRGYTVGIIGLCSGTGDLLQMIQHYQAIAPGNILERYIPALERVNGTDSHTGLDPTFVGDWQQASADPVCREAYDWEIDQQYFTPAVNQALADGLRALGQFIYFDSRVILGDSGAAAVRDVAMGRARVPAQGGSETTYLNAYLDAYVASMRTEEAHMDTTRIDTESRVFLNNGNLDLNLPLSWSVYGEAFHLP